MQGFKQYLNEWLFGKKKKAPAKEPSEYKAHKDFERQARRASVVLKGGEKPNIAARDISDPHDFHTPVERLTTNVLHSQHNRLRNTRNRSPELEKRHREVSKEREMRGFKPRMDIHHLDNFQSVKPEKRIHYTDEHGNKRSGY